MNPRRTCQLLLACVVVLTVSAAAARAAESDPPQKSKPLNVLVLLSDDQRFDTIHALGNAEIRTPNMDRLVNSGFTFRNNYVMGAMQGAVCMPSRAMFNSGRTLWHVKENLAGVPLWGETMQHAGYATYGTGKWHNGQPSFVRSFQAGKAVFFGGMHDHWAVPVQDLDAGQWSPKRIGQKFSSELFADAAIGFLRAHKGPQPFFLYVAFTAPHDPRTPPGEYATMYDPQKLPLPKNFMPQHPFDNGELWVRDEMLAPHPRTPAVVRRHLADYYGMISHLDAQIGRILAALKETGRADDTLILFTADNGLAVGQHGLFGKQSLYEHSAKMPLVLSGPGVPKGSSDALAYLLDSLPTVCELVGLKPPAGVEGKSLAPIVRGRQQKVRDYVLLAYRQMQRAVREPRWKLIKYHVGGVKTVQLFDLENDPCELKNLADDPACTKHRKRLESLLEKARAAADDPVDFEGVGGKPSGPQPKGGAKGKAGAKEGV